MILLFIELLSDEVQPLFEPCLVHAKVVDKVIQNPTASGTEDVDQSALNTLVAINTRYYCCWWCSQW